MKRYAALALATLALTGCATMPADPEAAAIATVQAGWAGDRVPSDDAVRDAFVFACLAYAEGFAGRTGAADGLVTDEQLANSDLIAKAAADIC